MTRTGARPADRTREPVSAWHADGVEYRHATDEDQEPLHSLLAENPMDSWIRLSLERRPNYFAGERLLGESCTVIACSQSAVAGALGMYSCRYLPIHLNGQLAHAGYLGELRVHHDQRHRIRLLRSGYASIPRLIPQAWKPACWFTSIASGNQPARRLLEAGLPALPRYRPVGTNETLAFSTRLGRSDSRWQPAERNDIPALARFFNRHAARWQFSPVLEESWLAGLNGSNGLCLSDFRLLKIGATIRGCLAIWDQRKFKQTWVRGYRTPLANLRAAYNLWARLTRRPELPPPGEQLDSVFLAFATFDDPERAIVTQGVRDALAAARRKGAAIGVLGLSPTNPLLPALQRALKSRSYETCIYTVDLAGTEACALDSRAPQPEVAIL